MKAGTQDFKQLYLDHYAALCFFALKIVGDRNEAEDIVEDVFVKLLHSKKTFTESDNLRAYLYTSTKNASLSHLTQSTRAKERQWQYNSSLPESDQAYINEMIRAEVVSKVMQAIKQLPGHTGKIIELSYFEGMKNDQIAELLGISVQTVKNLKTKGLAALKTTLSPDLFILFMLVYGLKGL